MRDMKVVRMPMDGNCLFHALGYPKVNHCAVRRVVVRHMRDHWDDYRHFVSDDPHYLGRMARLGEWGDELSIRAYHDATGHPLRVYDAQTGNLISTYGAYTPHSRRLVYHTDRGHYDVCVQ